MRGWITPDFKNSILMDWKHKTSVHTGLVLEEKDGIAGGGAVG